MPPRTGSPHAATILTRSLHWLAFVYQSVFADGQPPPHVLLRDYARGVIERALYLEAQLELDEALIRPPYGSEWPRISSADELALLAPRPEIADAGPYDPRRAENAIHFSVMDWDFAKYIIGADGVRGSLAPAPLVASALEIAG